MRKIFSSTLRVIVALFLSLFMTNFAPVMVAHAAPQPWTEATNHVEYWQDLGYGICTKIDNPGGTSYTLGAPAAGTYWSLLVVKAAQVNEVYENPQAGTAYDAPLNDKNKPRDVSHVIFCYKPTPRTEVTPVAPTNVDPCGTADDKYTITATTGVVYKVDGTVTPAGTYTGSGTINITAEAEAGYVLTGTEAWTFTFTNVPCTITVTPVAPTNVDPCGKKDDTFTIPATAGVIYKISDFTIPAGTYPGVGSFTVTAHAKPGYVLAGDTSWTFTFTNAPCPITVTPPAPHSVDLCGTNHDYYTVPFKKGVEYRVNGNPVSAGIYPGAGTVVITAHAAAAHYTLTGTTTWTFNFTNAPCVSVTVDSTQPCVERGSTDGQITVSVTNNHLIKKQYRVTVDGNVQTEFINAGESRAFTFTGLAAGSYDVDVAERNLNLPFNLAPTNAVSVVPQMNTHSIFRWDNVFSDKVTIDECPVEEPTDVCPTMTGTQTNLAECPGQVLGDTTGHILSTTTDLPSTLPATGSMPSFMNWLPMIAAVITYLIAYKKNSRADAKA